MKEFSRKFLYFSGKAPSPIKKEAVLFICDTNQPECRGASIKRPYPQLTLTSSSWSCCAKQSPSHHITQTACPCLIIKVTSSSACCIFSLTAKSVLGKNNYKTQTHLWKQADESPGMRTSAALSRHAVGLKWATLLRLIEVASISCINTL